MGFAIAILIKNDVFKIEKKRLIVLDEVLFVLFFHFFLLLQVIKNLKKIQPPLLIIYNRYFFSLFCD